MVSETLTDLEMSALLPNVINLSDGHARQSLGLESRSKLEEVFGRHGLPSSQPNYFEAESGFLRNLTHHTGQKYVDGQRFVTYASSVAMGVVATHLLHEGKPVGVICPTFDNVPGILMMMGVRIVPVPEEWLMPHCDFDRLKSLDIGSLLLVVPNNPTGSCMDRSSLCDLLRWASERGVKVILDLAFRWFNAEMQWDIIAEADSCNADVITIDDTGKILSLADIKVGVISTSRSLSRPIRSIHNQYILNVSELTLRLLTAMTEPDRPNNEVARAGQIVRANHRHLTNAIESYNSYPGRPWPSPSYRSDMSVQWLRLPGDRTEILSECRTRGLEILPGDNFYWSPTARSDPRACVRIAMMRDTNYFVRGLSILIDTLRTRRYLVSAIASRP